VAAGGNRELERSLARGDSERSRALQGCTYSGKLFGDEKFVQDMG